MTRKQKLIVASEKLAKLINVLLSFNVLII